MMEQEFILSEEVTQKLMFEEIKKMALEHIGVKGFSFTGEELTKIFETFKIETTEEVQTFLTNRDYKVNLNPEQFASFQDPIELRHEMQNEVSIILALVEMVE